MTIQIDASEVLCHLNSYGIQCIEEGTFEQFIQDLKKLIKYEHHKKEVESKCRSRTNRNVKFQDDRGHRDTARKRHEDEHIWETHNMNDRISVRSFVDHQSASARENEKKGHNDSYCKRYEVIPDTDRPVSSLSYSKSVQSVQTNARKKKQNSNPVELYHYYQSIWKQHKLPGENDHAQLRRAIRSRLMSVK